MSDLAASILRATATGTPVRLAFGTVTDTSPLQVALDGASTGVTTSRLSSYTPAGSDFVAVLVQGTDRLIIGKVA